MVRKILTVTIFVFGISLLGIPTTWGQDTSRKERLKRIEERLQSQEIYRNSYFGDSIAADPKRLQEEPVHWIKHELNHLEEGLQYFKKDLMDSQEQLSFASPNETSRKLDLEEDIAFDKEMIEGIEERLKRAGKRMDELENQEKRMGPKATDRLIGERDRIDAMKKSRDDTYGFNSDATLRHAFKKRGVKGETALSYAKDWGRLHFAWINHGSVFYTDHLDALNSSIAYLKGRKTSHPGEIAFLLQRINAWNQIQKQLDSLFSQLTSLMAKQAYELDQKHTLQDKRSKIEKEYLNRGSQAGDDYNYSEAEKEKERKTRPIREKELEHNRRAHEADLEVGKVRDQIQALSEKRVFSSIART